MSAADALTTLGIYAATALAIVAAVVLADYVNRRRAAGRAEGATYDRARAAGVALRTPIAHRANHPTARHVTADDLADVLYVDEWERWIEDGAA